MLGDLGGAFSVPTAGIGFTLGLFDALHRAGPATATELAKRTGLAERNVREWALAQAANGYIAFDKTEQRFSLSPEQAMVFAVKDSPVYLEGSRSISPRRWWRAAPRSKPPSRPEKVSPGAKALAACFAPSAHSSAPAMSTASCSPDSRHSRECRRS
jgi:hypothetical protein